MVKIRNEILHGPGALLCRPERQIHRSAARETHGNIDPEQDLKDSLEP
jgi:hypothetical protein